MINKKTNNHFENFNIVSIKFPPSAFGFQFFSESNGDVSEWQKQHKVNISCYFNPKFMRLVKKIFY